jgi:hypothetical protein
MEQCSRKGILSHETPKFKIPLAWIGIESASRFLYDSRRIFNLWSAADQLDRISSGTLLGVKGWLYTVHD